jgi:chemotaxis protein CheY-P-specific phosphatase CheC
VGNIFTLDSLREEVEKKYAPFVLEIGSGKQIELKNLLRLPKEQRTEVVGLLNELEKVQESDERDLDQLSEMALEVLRAVAGTQAAVLEKVLENDITMILSVLEHWMGGSQAGEAESSPS